MFPERRGVHVGCSPAVPVRVGNGTSYPAAPTAVPLAGVAGGWYVERAHLDTWSYDTYTCLYRKKRSTRVERSS